VPSNVVDRKSIEAAAQVALTSDQGDDFPLRIVIGLDVSGGRS
jgi:hypothetical protein